METTKHHSTTLEMKGKIERTLNSVKCLAFHEIYPVNRAVTAHSFSLVLKIKSR